MTSDDFEPWMSRWGLTPDGESFANCYHGAVSSRLAPVIHRGAPAMLKIAGGEEERLGGALMDWFAGHGAASVLEREGPAILLERASGPRSLAAMARSGEDDEATRVLCRTLARLHAPRQAPPPESLVPLPVWFRALMPAAARHGGVLAAAQATAEALLANPRDVRPLHGDLHHDNVLDAGARGWLAIDPKGLIGERGFDYANIACNPDIATAGAPGMLVRRARIIAAEAGLDLERYLRWVLAYAGLSASWTLGDGWDATPALDIAGLAARELGLI
ncbi:MAG TPA: aminoglycoside phosphotransferase family protein [Caulobacteraceae bacterium]